MYVHLWQTKYCTPFDAYGYKLFLEGLTDGDNMIILHMKNNVTNGLVLAKDIHRPCWAHSIDNLISITMPGDGYWEYYDSLFPIFPQKKRLSSNMCNIEINRYYRITVVAFNRGGRWIVEYELEF